MISLFQVDVNSIEISLVQELFDTSKGSRKNERKELPPWVIGHEKTDLKSDESHVASEPFSALFQLHNTMIKPLWKVLISPKTHFGSMRL